MASPSDSTPMNCLVIERPQINPMHITVKFVWGDFSKSRDPCPICFGEGAAMHRGRYTDMQCMNGHVWHSHFDGRMKAAVQSEAEALALLEDGGYFTCSVQEDHAPGWNGASPANWEERSLNFIHTENKAPERKYRITPCFQIAPDLIQPFFPRLDSSTAPIPELLVPSFLPSQTACGPLNTKTLKVAWFYSTHVIRRGKEPAIPSMAEVADLISKTPMLKDYTGMLFFTFDHCNKRGEVDKEKMHTVCHEGVDRFYAKICVYFK